MTPDDAPATAPMDTEDFWEHAPCGHVVASPEGRIVRANATLAAWLGHPREALRGRLLTDLMTVGSTIHYETHFGPLLRLSGELSGVTLDFVTADGRRLPIFVTANVKRAPDGTVESMRVTAQDASDRRAYERELLRERRRAEREQAQTRALADTLRMALLPPSLSQPEGLQAAEHYHPASPHEIGGDFYDLFPLSRSTWGFFLGDVAGKGVDAAVLTALTRYALRTAATLDDDPVEVLHALDAVLDNAPGRNSTRFCTVLYGRIAARDNAFQVEMSSGGHPPPLVLRADGSAVYADTIGGQAVGMIRNPRFVSTRFTLHPGDTLLLYSDGLTEARTGPRERFDDTGALLDFARAHSPSTAEEIVGAIRDLITRLGSGVQDDAAVLALSVPRD